MHPNPTFRSMAFALTVRIPDAPFTVPAAAQERFGELNGTATDPAAQSYRTSP